MLPTVQGNKICQYGFTLRDRSGFVEDDGIDVRLGEPAAVGCARAVGQGAGQPLPLGRWFAALS